MSEEEEKKGEESAEAKVARIQANAQAYLLGAYEQISKNLRTESYDVVLAHTPKQNDGGSGIGLVSKLANAPTIQNFIDASPAQLSILVPRIEFFFVHEENGKLREEPFVFSDHVSGERMVAMAKKLYGGNIDITNGKTILDASTAGSSVGIKEFTWMFDNKHEGDKTLKASVTLSFASAAELLTQQFLRFIFNVNSPEELVKQSDDKTATLEELGRRFGVMKQKALGQVPQENKIQEKKDFKQLKIKVGWSMPQRSIDDLYLAGHNKEQVEDFVQAVAATQKTILLNFTKYKLDFGQQGQVTLNVEYVGSLDSLLSDPEAADIFTRTATTKTSRGIIVPRAVTFEKGWVNWGTLGLIDMGNNVKEGKLSDKAFGFKEGASPVTAGSGKVANLGGQVGFLSRELHREALTDPFTNGPGFNTSMDAVVYEEKTLLMARQYLLEANDGKGEKYSGQISKIDKGIDACRYVRSVIDSRYSTNKHSQFMTHLLNSGKVRFVEVSPNVFEGSSPEGAVGTGRSVKIKVGRVDTNSIGGGIGKRTEAFNSAMVNKRTTDAGLTPTDAKFSLDPSNPTVGGENKEKRILFFTLGDLIDVANTVNEKGQRQTLLELVDGNIVLGSFNGKDIGLTTENSSLPIADIPINVEWFGQWFIDNYTGGNPPPQRISIRSFINKLLSNLIAPLINQALETPNKKVSINFSMTTLTYPKTPGTDLKAKASVGRAKGRFDNAIAAEVAKAATANQSMSTAKETRTFFLVFATIKDKGKLKGNFAQDRANGIFHVSLGSDRGIVKSFSFSEKKMPQLRAMHIENNNKGSALILPQDVELTMVGNTFFRNGSIIYIDAGFALGNEVARKLGIGGYYMVVKSENTISASTFETRLTCMFLQRPGEV